MAELIKTLAPYGLLVAGIGVLLLSTRQWRLPVRMLVWAVGFLLLAGAIALRPNVAGSGLGKMLANLAANWSTPDQSAIWEILSDNWVTVDSIGPPLLDITTTAALALAAIALFALTPGDRTERLLRPLLIGLVGGLAGAFIAIVLVASGLAGYHKDRVYAATMSNGNVYDGDTLRIGERLIRLNGIDAPERKQTCLGANLRCGEASRDVLLRAVVGKLVVCEKPEGSRNDDAPKEALGRPILDCDVKNAPEPDLDLSQYMIDQGAAVLFKNSEGKLKSHLRGENFRFGCMLQPYLWRNKREARDRFDQRKSRDGELIGACRPTPR